MSTDLLELIIKGNMTIKVYLLSVRLNMQDMTAIFSPRQINRLYNTIREEELLRSRRYTEAMHKGLNR
jgi:hypothetical protein